MQGWGVYCPFCRDHGSNVVVTLCCATCGGSTAPYMPLWMPPNVPPTPPAQHGHVDHHAGNRSLEHDMKEVNATAQPFAAHATYTSYASAVVSSKTDDAATKPAVRMPCPCCEHREKLDARVTQRH